MTRERIGSVTSTGSDAPEDFKCPLSLDLMRDPVTTPRGRHTFDRHMIERVIADGGLNPLTREPLRKEDLQPNRELKEKIDAYCREKGIVLPPVEIEAPLARVAVPQETARSRHNPLNYVILGVAVLGALICAFKGIPSTSDTLDERTRQLDEYSLSAQGSESYDQLLREKQKALMNLEIVAVYFGLSILTAGVMFLKIFCSSQQNNEQPPRNAEFLPPPEAMAVPMPDEHAALLGRMLR